MRHSRKASDIDDERHSFSSSNTRTLGSVMIGETPTYQRPFRRNPLPPPVQFHLGCNLLHAPSHEYRGNGIFNWCEGLWVGLAPVRGRKVRNVILDQGSFTETQLKDAMRRVSLDHKW